VKVHASDEAGETSEEEVATPAYPAQPEAAEDVP